MTNEEAKHLYADAVQRFEKKDCDGALELLDQLDRERPNSRHVNYHRALCLLELGRTEEAEQCYAKLEGRMDGDALQQLAAAIEVSKTSRRSASGISQFMRKHGDSASGSEESHSGNANVFVVQSSYPVSLDECSVVGHVKKGVFHVGDIASVVSPMGEQLPAPIVRIGPAETPVNFAREGQRVMMLLRVDPAQVGAGAAILCENRQSAYAETMVVAARSPKARLVAERPAELMAVERIIKQGKFAEAESTLVAYLENRRDSIAAKRMLAQVYLESPPFLRNVNKALEIIRSAYESGGADDPTVTFILAQALAENNDSGMGLRFLDRLYAGTTDQEARHALEQRVNSFRAKYGLGDIWEFADESGEVLFETTESSEIVKAVANGVIPRTAMCRRNHVGAWTPLEESAAGMMPEVSALFKEPMKKWHPGYILLLVFLVLSILVVVFFPRIMSLIEPAL